MFISCGVSLMCWIAARSSARSAATCDGSSTSMRMGDGGGCSELRGFFAELLSYGSTTSSALKLSPTDRGGCLGVGSGRFWEGSAQGPSHCKLCLRGEARAFVCWASCPDSIAPHGHLSCPSHFEVTLHAASFTSGCTGLNLSEKSFRLRAVCAVSLVASRRAKALHAVFPPSPVCICRICAAHCSWC